MNWHNLRKHALAFTLSCLAFDVFAEAPYAVKPGLFDTTQPDLGLSAAPAAQTVSIFKPGPGDRQFNNGVVLMPFKGKLYAQWQSSPKDEDSADTWVAYSVSDDGVHWGKPEVLMPAGEGGRMHSSGGWWTDGETLVAYINVWPTGFQSRAGGFTQFRSSRDGKTWSVAKDVTGADGKPVPGVIEQDPHALPDGRLINAFHLQPGIVVAPFYTDDPLGVSGWRRGQFANLPHEGPMSRELEPSLFLRDTCAVMVFRDEASSYRQLAAESCDGGQTWTGAAITDMPDSRAKQSAGNLPDGTAFLVNSPNAGKVRIPLAVTLSADGRVFDRSFLLRGAADLQPLRYQGKYKRPGYHYPKSTLWNDFLYVAYATNKEDVELTRVPLSSLSLPSAADTGFGPFRPNGAWSAVAGTLTLNAPTPQSALMTRAFADSIGSFEYRAPPGARATLYVQGRYGLVLEGNGDWQSFSVKFRGPRFDAGYQKQQNAVALELRNGQKIERNVLFEKSSEGARWEGEDSSGPNFLVVQQGPFSVRAASFESADFSQVTPPTSSGGDTNEKSLVDTVALGKETFESVGCSACHLVETSDTAVSSGPNLFGLFRPEPRAREVVEGEGEAHRFQVKAGREYLHRSVRAPAEQLAVAESGAKRGEAYPPAMPPFTTEVLSDAQIDAIGDYLATLNEPAQRGPVIKLASLAPAAPYDPMTDGLQWLVGDEVRIQRGALPGVSGRSIHVGHPNRVSYTFDPRVLAIVKVWQGGFLDMTGELTNRGGKGLALGYESREITFGDHEYLAAPLDARGQLIDFSFKEAKFGDTATMRAALYDPRDQLDRIRAVDAQFLGYSRDSRDKLANPAFKYRVGDNVVEVVTSISDHGEIAMTVTGVLKAAQSFALNPRFFSEATASTGTLAADRWTLPKGKVNATLRGQAVLAERAWSPPPTNYNYKRAPLVKTSATAQLPAGYSIENYYPPKDNYGRDQLFEALGLALTKDNTLVVGTRTAGIWRLVDGEWRLFAEGLFDSLGVVVEDDRGLTVVAGQKPELTRITDVNGDGIADKYETLFDAHSFHGNYHTYMHGPVRGRDGAYYIGLNLAHDSGRTTYNAGGEYMGTWGGLSGWAVRILANGKFELFANGLRSPASLAADPAGKLWYADNQGEFVGTSKLFRLEQGKFYGHPSGLVDLPGLTPDSPEVAWERWAGRREREIVLFPHNRVANSPGNPVWVTRSDFGPFAGQMLIGDQTQSNLLRVQVQKVGSIEQGSVMPFFAGLESGVMRPLFLRDGSLLLGQTGRGWQAKGGKVASLQHVRWDGKTIAPGITAMVATPTGFRIELTQPLATHVTESSLRAALTLESWTYRDAPDYGSDELDLRSEDMPALTLSADRKTISIVLASLTQTSVHPQQTGRVYQAKLAAKTLFDSNAPEQLEAYYTLHAFPVKR